MKELLVRSITGLVYGLLLVGSVILHPLAFLLVYLCITILSVNEFINISKRQGYNPQKISSLLLAAAVFLTAFVVNYYNIDPSLYYLLPALIILLFIIELFRKKDSPFINIGLTILSLIYIAIPLALFNKIVFNSYSEFFSYQLIIFIFMVLWLNDTGAYLTGKFFGKRKLIERISPKKTWEGLVGGIIIAFAVTAVFGKYFTEIPSMDKWIITGIIVLFGTFGDLVESMWKRSIGIKDSGKMLPGHGGWLDRLDSLLFAVPSVYLTITIMKLF